MTGEMSKANVTREAFPLHFAAADEINRVLGLGATVEPFDVYQGPYVLVPSKGRFWLIGEYDSGQWWSERTRKVSGWFFTDAADDVPACELLDLIQNGGHDPIEDRA